MEYFAGLDVSLRSCAICVVDGKGTVLHEEELPCEIEEISGYLTAANDARRQKQPLDVIAPVELQRQRHDLFGGEARPLHPT